MGSYLPQVLAESRTCATSFSGTRTIAWPAARDRAQDGVKDDGILDCSEQNVVVSELLDPGQEAEMIFSVRTDRLRCQLLTLGVDGDDCVRALVRIDPEQ